MSNLASREELIIEGPGGSLPAIVTVPQWSQGGALLLHPHPLYGGCKEDRIVLATEETLLSLGVATLRFDFRGPPSGLPYAGVDGAIDDALSAMDEMRSHLRSASQHPDIGVVGYSFGGSVALHIAGLTSVSFLVTISASYDIAADVPLLAERLSAITCPVLLLHGDRDSVVSVSDVTRIASLMDNADPLVRTIEGADHFYNWGLDEMTTVLRQFVSRVRPPVCPGSNR